MGRPRENKSAAGEYRRYRNISKVLESIDSAKQRKGLDVYMQPASTLAQRFNQMSEAKEQMLLSV